MDDDLAKICLTIYFAAQPDAERPSFESAINLSRYTWTRLTHLLKMATPYGWDTDAARWVEHVSRDIAGERCLSANSLTSSRGWWWFGRGALPAFGNVCALAWEADNTGMDVYPLVMMTGVWGPGTGGEGEPYSIGPVAFTGFRLEFDLSLDDYERGWHSLPGPLHTRIIGFVRFLITTGAALTNGNLVAHAVRVPRYARPQLVRHCKVQPFAPTVHVIRLRAQSLVTLPPVR